MDEVRTMKTRHTVMKHCNRLGDMADDVRIQLNDCLDLVPAEV